MFQKKWLRLLLLPPLALTCLLIVHTWRVNLPLLSPLDLIDNLPFTPPPPPTNKIVLGFLPYWNMKYSDEINIRHLTHLAYFGIDLDENGKIKRLNNPREEEPGWTKLNSESFDILHRQLKITNKRTILVVRAMTRTQIESILESTQTSTTATNSIMEVFRAKSFDDINIDFESAGTYSDKYKASFTQFVTSLRRQCRIANPSCQISVDIFSDSAIRDRLYDLPSLSSVTDYFVVMAYDFYRPSSSQAGPIAPLRGKCNHRANPKETCLDYDVTTSIADISKIVRSDQILLGIPFYGYQWQTADTSFLSNAYPQSGMLATFKRISSLFDDPTISSLSASWSANTQSPYLSFTKNNQLYQIYYEDSRSLSLKLDLVKQANLAGIAIWALGYETPTNILWDTIKWRL